MADLIPLFLAIVHGFVLASIHLFSILAGFGVYTLLGFGNQIAIQLPVAVLVSVSGYSVFVWLLDKVNLNRFNLRSRQGLVGTLLTSFLWAPALFIPAHYLTQGSLTSSGNILAVWVFQLPVNIFIYFLLQRGNLPKIQSA